MKKSHFLTSRAVTNNEKYERNACAFFDSNGVLWSFYARADNITQRSGSDIDNESYMIYYMRSINKGLTWTQPVLLNKTRPAGFNQRDLSALIDSSGVIRVFASSGDSGTYRPLIQYTSSDGGSTWSEAVPITIPGQPVDPLGGTRLGHSHVIYMNGKFHLVFQSSGGSAIRYSYSIDSVTWSTAVTIYASAHYVPKLMVESSGNLYLVTAKGASGQIWLAKSSDGVTWTSARIAGSDTAWGDWDPSIARLPNNDLGVVWAPNIGSDGQQLKATTSPDDGSSWTTPVDLTDGYSGLQEWWDYWPQIIVTGTQTLILYTSERKIDAPEFNGGNIWVFPPLPTYVPPPTPIYSTTRSFIDNTIRDIFS